VTRLEPKESPFGARLLTSPQPPTEGLPWPRRLRSGRPSVIKGACSGDLPQEGVLGAGRGTWDVHSVRAGIAGHRQWQVGNRAQVGHHEGSTPRSQPLLLNGYAGLREYGGQSHRRFCPGACRPHRATRSSSRRSSRSVVDPNWVACSNSVLGQPARWDQAGITAFRRSTSTQPARQLILVVDKRKTTDGQRTDMGKGDRKGLE